MQNVNLHFDLTIQARIWWCSEDRDSSLLELEDMSPSKDCSSGCRNSPIPSSGCSEAEMIVNVLHYHLSANDIGSIVKATMSPCDIDTTVQQLSTKEKYILLKHHNTMSHQSHMFSLQHILEGVIAVSS